MSNWDRVLSSVADFMHYLRVWYEVMITNTLHSII